jgi:RNA polymerase sigma-70 factor (ECF subfamily)
MDDMETSVDPPGSGEFDARYLAFLETITSLRPSLHRYCSRMTGSVMDGEDLVQESLFQAYRRLESFDDTRPLAPWLFRIAHNRCIDFLRRRGVREEAETIAMEPDSVLPADPVGPELGRAVERLVLTLPPKERACVLLKDVFDYSLEEIAELVDSTVGGVKAALNRGRSKLAPRVEPAAAPAISTELSRLLNLYVERFNRHDWDGLRDLISADARLQVADRFTGRLVDSPYFSRYEARTVAWRMALAFVDGEPAIVTLLRGSDGWTPKTLVRLDCVDGRIAGVRDYSHCPWMIPAAVALDLSPDLSPDVSPDGREP